MECGKMSILEKAELVKKNDGTYVKGYVYIKNYSKQPTKNGGYYLGGSLEAKGTMNFKVWGTADCFDEMDKYDYQNQVCFVSGKVNVYNGSYSLVIETCKAVKEEPGLTASEFYESRYDVDAYWNTLVSTVKKNVSAEAFEVFETVCNVDVREKFKTEFAAVLHHDNCRSGLLAHTAKVVKLCTIVKIYPNVIERVGRDLLFVGASLHDIGKIREYYCGTISVEGKRISHTTSGILMLARYQDKIVELKGADFYTELLSVISQHHGEYGETPRTVAAYVIHLLDCLDSVLTNLNQQLEGIESDSQISIDGMKLI